MKATTPSLKSSVFEQILCVLDSTSFKKSPYSKKLAATTYFLIFAYATAGPATNLLAKALTASSSSSFEVTA